MNFSSSFEYIRENITFNFSILFYDALIFYLLIIFQYIPKQRPTHRVNMLLFNFGGIQLALDDDLVFLFFQS